MIRIKRISLFLAAILCSVCFVACAGGNAIAREPDTRNLSAQEYTVLNTAGTDALGRTFASADAENKSLYTGMFFYLTLGYHADHNGIFDVSKITN